MTETKIRVRTEYYPVELHTRPALEMDEEQFFEFCQLNWDCRIERKVHVYRPEETVHVLESPENVSGDPVLPGFVFDLKPIWQPGF